MKLLVPVFALLFLLSACSGSADNKVPELANEMCDCFTNFQKGLSPEGFELLKKVGLSDEPQKTLTDGIATLKPDEVSAFAEKLTSIGSSGSDVFSCMQAFDKKHSKETTKDKMALTKKLLKAMRGNSNCPIGAAVVNLGVANGAVK